MNTALAVERMRQVIRRQHKALSTEDCYLFWLRRYIATQRTASHAPLGHGFLSSVLESGNAAANIANADTRVQAVAFTPSHSAEASGWVA